LAASHRLGIGIGIGLGWVGWNQVESGWMEDGGGMSNSFAIVSKLSLVQMQFSSISFGRRRRRRIVGVVGVGANASWQLAWVRTWPHPHGYTGDKKAKRSREE